MSMAITSVPDPEAHPFIPAQPGQSRSPCPALNTLANHNYLPRSGHDITLRDLVSALTHVYHLSFPLALLLSLVGILTCGSPRRMTVSLGALAEHNKLEHDASLVHADAAAATADQEAKPKSKPIPVFAPTTPDPVLLASFISLASGRTKADHGGAPESETRSGFDLGDIARARAGRDRELWESTGRRLGKMPQRIARGEVALAWLVMRGRRGDDGKGEVIPVRWVKEWFGEERLPDGWARPVRSVGLIEVTRVVGIVQHIVDGLWCSS